MSRRKLETELQRCEAEYRTLQNQLNEGFEKLLHQTFLQQYPEWEGKRVHVFNASRRKKDLAQARTVLLSELGREERALFRKMTDLRFAIRETKEYKEELRQKEDARKTARDQELKRKRDMKQQEEQRVLKVRTTGNAQRSRYSAARAGKWGTSCTRSYDGVGFYGVNLLNDPIGFFSVHSEQIGRGGDAFEIGLTVGMKENSLTSLCVTCIDRLFDKLFKNNPDLACCWMCDEPVDVIFDAGGYSSNTYVRGNWDNMQWFVHSGACTQAADELPKLHGAPPQALDKARSELANFGLHSDPKTFAAEIDNLLLAEHRLNFARTQGKRTSSLNDIAQGDMHDVVLTQTLSSIRFHLDQWITTK